MLDVELTAYERAGLEALAGLPLVPAGAITRRKLGYLPAKSDYYGVDLAILPTQGDGHPIAGCDVTLAVTVRVVGRGTDGVAVIDRVRFIADLALARLCAARTLAPLLGDVGGIGWQREIEIADGPTVVVETATMHATLRHTAGAGPADGVVARLAARTPGGQPRATLRESRVYAAGMSMAHVAPAAITALFAGLRGDGSERLELRGAGIATASDIASAVGAHTFEPVAAGDYALVIVDGVSGAELARSPEIRVCEAP